MGELRHYAKIGDKTSTFSDRMAKLGYGCNCARFIHAVVDRPRSGRPDLAKCPAIIKTFVLVPLGQMEFLCVNA